MKYIFALILLVHLHAQAQINKPRLPYEAIKFENPQPAWYHTMFDASLVSDTADGYNYFFEDNFDLGPLQDENHIYTAYMLDGKRGAATGIVIEKRDKTSGIVTWLRKIDLSNTYNRVEVVKMMHFDENGDIVLITLRAKNKYPGDVLGSLDAKRNMQFNRRIVNKQTGVVEYELNQPFDRDSSYIFHQYRENASEFQYLFREGDQYRLIGRQFFNFPTSRNITNSWLIGKDGLIIGSKDTLSNGNGDAWFNIAQIHEDTLVRIERSIDGSGILKFDYLDKHLKILKTVQGDAIPGYVRVKLENYHDGIFLLNIYYFDSIYYSADSISFVTYDLNGKKKVNGTILIKDRIGINSYIMPLRKEIWNTHNYINQIDVGGLDSTYLEINKVNHDNTLSKVVRIYGQDKYKIFVVKEMMEDDNGDVILWLDESLLYLKNNFSLEWDFNARARSIIRIKKEDLEGPTAVKNIVLNTENMMISPNPSSSKITITQDKPMNGTLRIFDNHGKLYTTSALNNEVKYETDISDLPSGHYTVTISNGAAMVTGRFIKSN